MKKKSDLTYCEKDYHNRHYWERINVYGEHAYSRCAQCEKWKREKIVYVKGGK